MQFVPYEYQLKAIDFICSHKQTVLFLDMGLGKTAISLTAFTRLREQGKVHKLLVVAPKRVAEVTWPDEVANWDHTKDYSVSLIAGTPQKREKACRADADIYVIGRDSLKWLVESKLCPKADMLVVDEMQSFKTWNAARTKAMNVIREPFEYVVGLSGTPAPNGWEDLWSQYNVVDKGAALGTQYWPFLRTHFNPGKRIIVAGRERILNWVMKPGHKEIIENAVLPFTLSMQAIDHLDLPGITYQTASVVMSDKEKADYEAFASCLEGYVGGEKLKVPTDEALVGKLVQLATGTAYNAEGKPVYFHSHKLDALEEIYESVAAEGKSLLVAYWFKADRDRITQLFAKNKSIRFGEIDSQENIEKWNNGKLDVALIHPAKAGHGLNLQKGGCTLVWYTLPWNFELYAQTNCRLYRNGQTKHVNVIQIMTRDTIDGAIYGVLKKKRRAQDDLFNATKTSFEEKQQEKKAEAKANLETAAARGPEPDNFDDLFGGRPTNMYAALSRYIYVPADQNTVLPPVIQYIEDDWLSDDWGDLACSMG